MRVDFEKPSGANNFKPSSFDPVHSPVAEMHTNESHATWPNAFSSGGSQAKNPHDHHLQFATKLIHVGSEASEETGAVIPGINLSTTYKQSEIGVHKGYEYTRSNNPNRQAFEAVIASLELPASAKSHQAQHLSAFDRAQEANLPAALAFSSGSAVTGIAIQALVGHGNHLICISDVYGGTYRYMTKVAKDIHQIDTSFVDMSFGPEVELEDADTLLVSALESAFRDNTKLVWLECPTNPTLRMVDIAVVARVAHAHGALVLVDNTFLSPYYARPLALGADVVMHSTTKFINGHSDVAGGVVVSDNKAVISRLRFFQNASGAIPSPFDCWLAHRGVKTLELRMRRHGESALAVAQWLSTVGVERGWVTSVIYPGLEGDDNKNIRRLAWRQLAPEAKSWIISQGYTEDTGFPYSGMVSFRINTPNLTADDGTSDTFLSSLNIFTLAESLGGVESLAELPSKMTHASVSAEDRAKLGIDNSLIRLSIGIEDSADLIRDLESAFIASVSLQHPNGVKKAH